MKLTLIAAMAQNRAIGKDNGIPWHYPEDFAHFKRETLGGTLIMGRATYESIGRPLPGRSTIVLTRDTAWTPGYANVKVAHELESALELSREEAGETFIAGGAQVYELAFPFATDQILTTIPITVPGADAFYPAFDAKQWTVNRRISLNGLTYEWLSRIDSSSPAV